MCTELEHLAKEQRNGNSHTIKSHENVIYKVNKEIIVRKYDNTDEFSAHFKTKQMIILSE